MKTNTIEKKYLALLKTYEDKIDEIYNLVPSSNYTPDYMTYDYDGYLEYYNNDDYIYYKELKKAVNKAKLYTNYLNDPYINTFG